MKFFVKTPWWIRKMYSDRIWEIQTEKKEIFLTFDDGPCPNITQWILGILNEYNAKATFFCVGKNVKDNFDIYENIIAAGHAVGNHTYNHLNGWKEKDDTYLLDIFEAKKIIDSKLFRPPYGRITSFQQQQLKAPTFQLKTIMWSVLSGDFDPNISEEKCLNNVLLNTQSGSIVVFHDSQKARPIVVKVLPSILKYFSEKGYVFRKIEESCI